MDAGSNHRMGDPSAALMATDIEAIGRLVRQRTLDAVALHFTELAERTPADHEPEANVRGTAACANWSCL